VSGDKNAITGNLLCRLKRKRRLGLRTFCRLSLNELLPSDRRLSGKKKVKVIFYQESMNWLLSEMAALFWGDTPTNRCLFGWLSEVTALERGFRFKRTSETLNEFLLKLGKST